MRIFYLAGANSPHSHRWISYFANAGHNVYWVSFGQTIQEIPSSIQYFEIRSNLPKPFNIIEYILKTRRILKKARPDILHAHSAGTYGLIALFSSFQPFVLTAWGSDVLLNPRQIIKRMITKKILHAADLITCDGDNTTDAMIALGARREVIHRIRFGIDTNRFARHKVDKKKLFGTEGPVIISTRNLEPLYDIETLIHAAHIVGGKNKNVQFIIGGSGSEREKLEKLSARLNLNNIVKFIGAIPSAKMPDYLNATDIYVSTALSDSDLAASTAEAMATELPVIITDSGDNRKWVRSGENGFIIPVKSPKALAEKILYLLEHQQERGRFAEANRTIIKEKNDYVTEMGKMEKLYEKVIANNKATS